MKKISTFLLSLGILVTIGINSCKKDERFPMDGSSSSALTSVSQLSESQKVHPQEMLAWVAATFQGTQLQPLWNKAMQSVVNGSHVVEVPTSADAALFFTKVNGALNVYAYKWLSKGRKPKAFTGKLIYYSFQDNTVMASVYKKGRRIKNGVFNVPSAGLSPTVLNKKITGPIGLNNTITYTSPIGTQKTLDGDGGGGPGVWIAWLACMISGGNWTQGYGADGCNVFEKTGWLSDLENAISAAVDDIGGLFSGSPTTGDGDISTSATTDETTGVETTIGDDGTVTTEGISVSPDAGPLAWVTVNSPCIVTTGGGDQSFGQDDPGSSDPCPAPVTTWTPIPVDPPQVAGVDYMSPDVSDDDPDNNPDGGEDNTVYPDYQDGTPWPTIANVISKSNFIIFDGSSCLVLAKQQISPRTISDYGTAGQTINAYTEGGGANLTKVKEAIVYINSELSNGRPVIVGVDVRPGQPLPITDNSTDHFIVIVGIGTDSKGNFYQFYDSSTKNVWDGTSNNNKLYYNPTTGKISGNTDSGYDNASAQASHPGQHPYIMTQVRKNKKP